VSEPSASRNPGSSSAEAALFTALQGLYARAGEPSTRAVAKAIGGMSHTTVHAAIRGTTVPTWPVLDKLVQFLGGDTETFRALWADIRPTARVWKPTLSPEISVFVSYARIDDKASYNRVSQLVESLADIYESETGQTVGVFKDIESIKPGDDWRDRIRLGLSASSIFLAFISPAYLRSASCREELSEFIAFLDANSSARLIVPLIFASPDRILNEFADDELWMRISNLQWLDVSQLRFTDPGTSTWLMATSKIVNRIDEVLRSFASSNDLQVEDREKFVEMPEGKLERMAALENKLPDLLGSLGLFAELMEKMTDAVNESSPAMQRADSFGQKLAVSNRLAARLDPIAGQMESAASDLVGYMNELTFVTKYVVDEARRNPDKVESGVAEFLQSIEEAATTGVISLTSVEEFNRTLAQAIGISRKLDKPLKQIQRACLRIADLRGILSGWQEEVGTLYSRYPQLAQDQITERGLPAESPVISTSQGIVHQRTAVGSETRTRGVLKTGTRVSGADRAKLAADLKRRYESGEGIRSLAASTGRSYGFIHRILTENGIQLRGRGSATRGRATARR
jgi:hypothetical protein